MWYMLRINSILNRVQFLSGKYSCCYFVWVWPFLMYEETFIAQAKNVRLHCSRSYEFYLLKGHCHKVLLFQVNSVLKSLRL